MSQIGPNHHLSVANTLKQQTRALYEGVLGAIGRFTSGMDAGQRGPCMTSTQAEVITS